MTESNNREYKQIWKDEFLKVICAFANADGGMLEIGRKDDGSVLGVEKANRLLEDLPNKVQAVLGIVVDSEVPEKASGKGLVDGWVEGLVESQYKIWSLLQENPRLSKREMAEKIGISTTAIDKNIEVLKSKGVIARIGSTTGGHWEVLK